MPARGEIEVLHVCSHCQILLGRDEVWAGGPLSVLCGRCALAADPCVCSACRGWGVIGREVCQACGGEG